MITVGISDLMDEYKEFEDNIFDIEEKMEEYEKDDDEYDMLLGQRNDILEDDRYIALKDFAENIEKEYENGTMVQDVYIEEYIRDNYEEMTGCVIPTCIKNYIDWDAVANDMSAEYTTIEFDGNSYYIV